MMYQFEKGEFINTLADPYEHLVFIDSADVRIFHLRDDDTLFRMSPGNGIVCLGDMEFAYRDTKQYLIEVAKRTHAVVLSLDGVREELENDPAFLRFLLSSTWKKAELHNQIFS